MIIFDGLTLYSDTTSASIAVSGNEEISVQSLYVTAGIRVLNGLYARGNINLGTASIPVDAINWNGAVSPLTLSALTVTGSASIANLSVDDLNVTNSADLTIKTLSFTDDADPVDLPEGSSYNGRPFDQIVQPELKCGFIIGRKWKDDNDINIIPCGLPEGTWYVKIQTSTRTKTVKVEVTTNNVAWSKVSGDDPFDGTEQSFWHAAYCMDNIGTACTASVSSSDSFPEGPTTITETINSIGSICDGFVEAPLSTNQHSRVKGQIVSHDDNILTVIFTPRYDRFLSFGDIYWWGWYADKLQYRYAQYMMQDNNYYDRGQQDIYGHFKQYDLDSPIGAQPSDCSSENGNYPMREPMCFIITYTKTKGTT